MSFGFVVVDEAKLMRHEGRGKLFSAWNLHCPLN